MKPATDVAVIVEVVSLLAISFRKLEFKRESVLGQKQSFSVFGLRVRFRGQSGR